jgi:hypothetical protein
MTVSQRLTLAAGLQQEHKGIDCAAGDGKPRVNIEVKNKIRDNFLHLGRTLPGYSARRLLRGCVLVPFGISTNQYREYSRKINRNVYNKQRQL